MVIDLMASPQKPRLSFITSFSSNRDSIIARNVSNPFSLTVPERHSKRASKLLSIPLGTRPASSIYSQNQAELVDKTTPQKKIVMVAERPIRPHPENRQSEALAYYKHRNPYSTGKRKFRVTCWRIDDRVLALSVTITLAVLIIIGVPLVAVIAQKYIVQLPINVLVPSSAFADAGSWDRLYNACVFLFNSNRGYSRC